MPRGCTPRKRRADDHRPGTGCTPVSLPLQQLLVYSTNRSYHQDQGTERSGFLPRYRHRAQVSRKMVRPRTCLTWPRWQRGRSTAAWARVTARQGPQSPRPRGAEGRSRARSRADQCDTGRREQFRHRAAGRRPAGELVTPQCCLRDVVLLAPPCRARLRGFARPPRSARGMVPPASRARGRPGGMPVCNCTRERGQRTAGIHSVVILSQPGKGGPDAAPAIMA